jgi:hypothetical protein
MTSAPGHEDYAGAAPRRPGRRRPRLIKWTAAIATLLGPAVLAAGCAGSNSAGIAGSESSKGVAQLFAYSRCMRSHGLSDFPDPTTSPGGGAAISIQAGPDSDLNRRNPTFKAASHACRGLLPGGGQPVALSAPRIAAEVRWARCMRSHGLPSFPDPNSQGAFDSAKFDESSPPFQTASQACNSVQPTGPTPVVAGQP